VVTINGRGPARCADSGGETPRTVDTGEGDGGFFKPKSTSKQRLTNEQALLALIAKNLRLAVKVAEQTKLHSEHFKDPLNGKWFASMLTAAKNGKTRAADPEYLRNSPNEANHYLADLIEKAPAVTSERHAENMARKFARQILGQENAPAKRSANGKAEPVKSDSRKAKWMDGLALDRELSPFDVHVAVVLLYYVNSTTLRTIADHMNRTERAVRKAIAMLVSRGHLTLRAGTRGMGGSNCYRLALPSTPEPAPPEPEPEQPTPPPPPPEPEMRDEIPF
jgi:hypothetical protein